MASPTDTTRKIRSVQAENEKQAALTAYLKAYDVYANQKTAINLKAMTDAYDHLQEVKKLYQDGHRIKRDRAVFGNKS